MTYAIYSEWVRDADVRMDLFVPSINLGAKVLAPTLWLKELSGAGRRKWNAVPNAMYHASGDQYKDVSNLLEHEINQFEGISNWMTSVIADPQWDLRAAFPVLVTSTDLILLSEKATVMPPDLNERVLSLRTVLGLPALPGKAGVK
jgi:hypothetical protein